MRSKLFLLILLVVLVSFSVSFAETSFRFAILGDRAGSVNQGAFEMVVDDVVTMHPDFVMTVGDIPDDALEGEWQVSLKTLEKITCPLYYTPGNNDMYDEKTAKVYTERTGYDPYYSFDRENTHFIILNNAIANSYDEMGDEQIAWLEEDLEKNQEKANIFVFMHKPFWADLIAEGKEDKLHELYKKYGVDAVFTGHWHRYAYEEIDGIQYYIVGSSGGGWSGPEDVPLGGFYQFIWCTVKDDQLFTSIIHGGSVYEKDLVNISENKLVYQIATQLVSASGKMRGDDNVDVEVVIKNDTEKVISSQLHVKTGENWEINSETIAVEIPAGEKFSKYVQLMKQGNFFPLPTMSFAYPFGREKEYNYQGALNISRAIAARKVATAPQIDGKIIGSEWATAKNVEEFCNFDGTVAKTDDTRISFVHDDEFLYMAAICGEKEMENLQTNISERDEAVYNDDCVGLLISPQKEVIYQVYVNSQGVIFDQKIDLEADKAMPEWDGNWQVMGETDGPKWIVELKIPLEDLGYSAETKELKLNVRRKQQRNRQSALFSPTWSYDASKWGSLILE